MSDPIVVMIEVGQAAFDLMMERIPGGPDADSLHLFRVPVHVRDPESIEPYEWRAIDAAGRLVNRGAIRP